MPTNPLNDTIAQPSETAACLSYQPTDLEPTFGTRLVRASKTEGTIDFPHERNAPVSETSSHPACPRCCNRGRVERPAPPFCHCCCPRKGGALGLSPAPVASAPATASCGGGQPQQRERGQAQGIPAFARQGGASRGLAGRREGLPQVQDLGQAGWGRVSDALASSSSGNQHCTFPVRRVVRTLVGFPALGAHFVGSFDKPRFLRPSDPDDHGVWEWIDFAASCFEVGRQVR